MRTHNYPSDVTDEQWPLIEPHLPAARPGGLDFPTNGERPDKGVSSP